MSSVLAAVKWCRRVVESRNGLEIMPNGTAKPESAQVLLRSGLGDILKPNESCGIAILLSQIELKKDFLYVTADSNER